MKIVHIESKLNEIKEAAAERDDERAHSLQDALFREVLTAIANGESNPMELAQECLSGAHDQVKNEKLFDFETVLRLVEAVQNLHDFFDDNDKVAHWLITDNPHFGGSSPLSLFNRGRGHKVSQFINSAKMENQDDPSQ